MRTRYSEDQQAVQEAFGELFAREATSEAVRDAEAGCGFDAGLWRKLAAAGAPGMALSTDQGGGGASLVDLSVVAYEWGRRIAPAPLIEHAVATRLLASRSGSTASDADATGLDGHADDGGTVVERELVDALAAGEVVATLALRPPDPGGMARLVPAGAVADVVVALRGDVLVVERSDPPRVSRPNTAGLPLADRDLSGACAVAEGDDASRAWDRALAEWKALMAVAYAGLAHEVLAMGVAYVKQRHQFGVPVGSFQAVQHGLADAATSVEGARLLAFRAVCALDARTAGTHAPDTRPGGADAPNAHRGAADSRPGAPNAHRGAPDTRPGAADAHRLASMALLFGAESARFASDRALQYHGGYGYSAEYDVQLYYRRAAAWLLQLGEPAAEIARLADADLGPKLRAA